MGTDHSFEILEWKSCNPNDFDLEKLTAEIVGLWRWGRARTLHGRVDETGAEEKKSRPDSIAAVRAIWVIRACSRNSFVY
jgi:hypothetical protein